MNMIHDKAVNRMPNRAGVFLRETLAAYPRNPELSERQRKMEIFLKRQLLRVLSTIVLSISLGACTSVTRYTKPGYTQEIFHRDKIECEQEAHSRFRMRTYMRLMGNALLNKYVNECLVARGYSIVE